MPGHFIRSFLAVAAGYVTFYFGLLMAMLLIARTGFPEIFEMWTSGADDGTFARAWETDRASFFPAAMCRALAVAALALAAITGALVTWFAPFSPMGHGVFLAVVCVLTWLQMAFNDSGLPRGLTIALLVVTPLGIVIGSWCVERCRSRREETAGREAPDSDNRE